MDINAVPQGYHTVTPYLVVREVAALIDFLKQALDAREIERMQTPDGRIMHAEVRIGDSLIMLGEAGEENPPTQSLLYIYLEDSDAVYRRALDAGATSLQEPKDEFYGDRTAAVKDAFGNQWWFATRVEEVSAEEMERRSGVSSAQVDRAI